MGEMKVTNCIKTTLAFRAFMPIIQRRSAAIHEADILLSYRSTLHEFYFVFGHMFSSKTLMNADKMLSKCRIRL
jgi:hypothetical protein